MAKNKSNPETPFVPEIGTDDQPIKRLSDFTEEKTVRVAEEMLNISAVGFDSDAIIRGYDDIPDGTSRFVLVTVQGSSPELDHMVITNSPAVIKKLAKVDRFPVLAQFTRREVRGKFRYDLK